MVEDSAHFFEVKTESFDGPIDLLLHLVKKNELPIEKLSLYQISQQYFDCLDRMRHLDLEIAGEYLVIAATLLSIKSSILLNEPPEFVEDDEGKMVDPHLLLLEKIREAAVYKESAMALSQRNILGLDVFQNSALFDQIEPIPGKLKNHDPILLAKAFAKVLDKRKAKGAPVFSISYDAVSIVERMMRVLDIVQTRHAQFINNGLISFDELIDSQASDTGTVVSTFLALLELAKRGAIAVSQADIDAAIMIGLADSNVSVASLSSEFDEPAPVNNESSEAIDLNSSDSKVVVNE
jgi:segregation and condensation protein A